MPKVIDGLQTAIMQSARKRLLSTPPDFSLRAVAKDCGIAVGTIYNYFPDKETLIASVFAEDWIGILQETETDIRSAGSMEDGLRAVYAGLERFTQSHRSVWNSVPVSTGAGSYFQKGHGMLLEQIKHLLSVLFERFEKEPSSADLTLTAELLIAASRHPEFHEEEIMRVLRRQL